MGNKFIYLTLMLIPFVLGLPSIQEGTVVDLSISSYTNELNVSVLYKNTTIFYNESGDITNVSGTSYYLKSAIVKLYFIDKNGNKKPLPNCAELITNSKRIKKIETIEQSNFTFKVMEEFYATCHFTPPISEGCTQVWAEFEGYIENSKDVYPPSSGIASFCTGKSAVEDILPSVLESFILNQLRNPSPGCISALIILGLAMTAFYYRYKTIFTSLLDITRPKIPQPKAMFYSYTGVGMHSIGKEGANSIVTQLNKKWRKKLRNKKFLRWLGIPISKELIKNLKSNKLKLGALVELYENGVNVSKSQIKKLLSLSNNEILKEVRQMIGNKKHILYPLLTYTSAQRVLNTYDKIYEKGKVAKVVFKAINKIKKVPVIKPLTVPLNRFATGVHRTFKINSRLFRDALILPPLLRRNKRFKKFVKGLKSKGGITGSLGKAIEKFVGKEPYVGKLFPIDQFLKNGIQIKRFEEALERSLFTIAMIALLKQIKIKNSKKEEKTIIELLSPSNIGDLNEAKDFKEMMNRAIDKLKEFDKYKSNYIEKLRDIIQNTNDLITKASNIKDLVEQIQNENSAINLNGEINYLNEFINVFGKAYQMYQAYSEKNPNKDEFKEVLFSLLLSSVNVFNEKIRNIKTEDFDLLPFYIDKKFEDLSNNQKVILGITNEFYNINKNKKIVNELKLNKGDGPGLTEAVGLFVLKEITTTYGYVNPEFIDLAYGPNKTKGWKEVFSEEGRKALKNMMEVVRDVLVKKIFLDETKFKEFDGIIDPVYLLNRYAIANYLVKEGEERVSGKKADPSILEKLKEFSEQARNPSKGEEFKNFFKSEKLHDYIARKELHPYGTEEHITEIGFMIPVVGKEAIITARDSPISEYYRKNGIDIGIALAPIGISGIEGIEGFPREFYEFTSLGNLISERTGVREIPEAFHITKGWQKMEEKLKKYIDTKSNKINELKNKPIGEAFLSLLSTDLSQNKLKGIITVYSNFTLGEQALIYSHINNMINSFKVYVARKIAEEKGTEFKEEFESMTMKKVEEFLNKDDNKFLTLKDLEGDQLFMVDKDGYIIPFEDILLPQKECLNFYADMVYGKNIKEKAEIEEVWDKVAEHNGSLRKLRENLMNLEGKKSEEMKRKIRIFEEALSDMGFTAGMWHVSVGYTPLNLDFKAVVDGKIVNMLQIESLSKKEISNLLEALEEGSKKLNDSDIKYINKMFRLKELNKDQRNKLKKLLEQIGYNESNSVVANLIVKFLSDKKQLKEKAEELTSIGTFLIAVLSHENLDLSKIPSKNKNIINSILEKIIDKYSSVKVSSGDYIEYLVNLVDLKKKGKLSNDEERILREIEKTSINLGKLSDIVKRSISKRGLSITETPDLLDNPTILEPLFEAIDPNFNKLNNKESIAKEVTNFLIKEVRERKFGKPLLSDEDFKYLVDVINNKIIWIPAFKEKITEIQDKLVDMGREDMAFKIGRWISNLTSDFDLVMRVVNGRKVFMGSTPKVRKSILKRMITNFKKESFLDSLTFVMDAANYLGFDLTKHLLYNMFAKPLWEIGGPEILSLKSLQGDYARVWMQSILYKKSLLMKAKESGLTKEDEKVLNTLEKFFTIAEWHQTREPGHISYNLVDRISRWAKLASTYHARMSQMHPEWLRDIYLNFRPYSHSTMGFGVMSRILGTLSYASVLLSSKAQSRIVLMLRGLNKSFTYHTATDIAYIKDEEILNEFAKKIARRYNVDLSDKQAMDSIKNLFMSYLYRGYMLGPKHAYIYKHNTIESKSRFNELTGKLEEIKYRKEEIAIPDVARGISHLFQHGLTFGTSSFFTMAIGATALSYILGLGPLGGFLYSAGSLLSPKRGWSFHERIDTGIATKGRSTRDMWLNKKGVVSGALGTLLGKTFGSFVNVETTGVADLVEKVFGFRPQSAFAGWYTSTIGAYHDIPGYMYYQYPTGIMSVEPWIVREALFENRLPENFYSESEKQMAYRFFQQYHVPLVERYLEGIKELSGYEPYYNYPYGFFSYAFFFPWLGYLFNSLGIPLAMKVVGPVSDAIYEARSRWRYISRIKRFGLERSLRQQGMSTSKIGTISSALSSTGLGKKIVGFAGTGALLGLGAISLGGLTVGASTILTTSYLSKANYTYCPLCGRKKPRGAACPYCGYKPSGVLF